MGERDGVVCARPRPGLIDYERPAVVTATIILTTVGVEDLLVG